jgi:hypothetical protein
MSRKRNSPRRGGKKAKDTPPCSLRRHRKFGKSQINRVQRAVLAREHNEKEDERRAVRRRRTEMFGSVRELLDHR